MMACFENVADHSEELSGGEGLDSYHVVIKNQLHFFLGIDYLHAGMSFRLSARVLLTIKERSGLARIGSCTDRTVSKYARIACVVDVRDCHGHVHAHEHIIVRVHLDRHGIFNAHILTVTVYERHTAEVIFDTAAKLLDALCPSWRDIIIGISTDGERKMTGRVSGVSTWLQNVAKGGHIPIWCGAHQLDIVLESTYNKLSNEAFY